MNAFCLKLVLIVLVVFGISMSQPAIANNITQKQAVEKVIQAYPGKVLKSTVVNRDGKRFYRVRMLLSDGKIINVLVNASNGRMRKE